MKRYYTDKTCLSRYHNSKIVCILNAVLLFEYMRHILAAMGSVHSTVIRINFLSCNIVHIVHASCIC